MGRKSKTKGSGFERQTAKVFEAALGIKFVRTPLSGGWGRYQTKGDLVPAPGSYFPYFIECKKGEGWEMWSTLFNNAGPLLNTWWPKAKQQAKEEDKNPVVVFAQNQKNALALFPLYCVHASALSKEAEGWFRWTDADGVVVIMTTLDTFLRILKRGFIPEAKSVLIADILKDVVSAKDLLNQERPQRTK